MHAFTPYDLCRSDAGEAEAEAEEMGKKSTDPLFIAFLHINLII